MARALVERSGALPRVLERLDAPRAPETDQVLVLEALGAFTDPASRAVLFDRSQAAAPAVREAATRALVQRADARDGATAALGRRLGEARDLETTLMLLDAIEPLLDPTLRPALDRLALSPHEGVREAAARLLKGLVRTPEARAEEGGKPAPDRYAPPVGGTPATHPKPPQVPPAVRTDLVYAFDVTARRSRRCRGSCGGSRTS